MKHTAKNTILLSATLLATLSSACTFRAGTSALVPRFGASVGTAATASSESAPSRSYEEPTAPMARKSFPTSGGQTPDTAEVIALGVPIEGVIADDTRLYYRFDVKAGQSETFLIYSEQTEESPGGSNMVVSLLAPDGEKLAHEMTATYASSSSPELDKDSMKLTFKQEQSVLMEVNCGSCALSPVHYKILTAAR